jgi:hypothetical protein
MLDGVNHMPNQLRSLPATAYMVAVMLASCDVFDPGECTLQAGPGVIVVLRDSISGSPVAMPFQVRAISGLIADSSTNFANRGTQVDTIMVNVGSDRSSVSLAYERAGTYRVEVEHPSYRPWARNGIPVREGRCHVETAVITAHLQRAGT